MTATYPCVGGPCDGLEVPAKEADEAMIDGARLLWVWADGPAALYRLSEGKLLPVEGTARMEA